MTQEGYDNAMAELEHLEKVERKKASAAIAEARDKGDLSENAEYDAAKEAQGLLEARIAKLKNSLAISRVIDPSQVDISKVNILTKVKLKNLKFNKEVTYTIVSEKESNLKEAKISVKSPIAKGLMGHKIGEIVDVTVPAGVIQFEILDISI